MFTQQLDFQTHKVTELDRNTLESSSMVLPTVGDFQRSTALENLEVDTSRGSAIENREKQTKQLFFIHARRKNEYNQNCTCCGRHEHQILKWFRFLGYSLNDKRKFIQDDSCCFNYLGLETNCAILADPSYHKSSIFDMLISIYLCLTSFFQT